MRETKLEPPRVVLETFRDLAPANIARGLLLARGIDATLQGDQLIGIAWHLSNAVGGVKLLVPAVDEDDARRLLDDSIAEYARGLEDAAGDESEEPDESTVVDFAAWKSNANGVGQTDKSTSVDFGGPDKSTAVDLDARPASTVVDLDHGRDPAPEATAADALVETAWRASLLGLFLLPPLGQVWSSYLLREVRLLGGPQTSRGKTLASRAAITNLVVLCLAAAAAVRWLSERS